MQDTRNTDKKANSKNSRIKSLNVSQEYIDEEEIAIDEFVEDNWNFIMSPMLEKVEDIIDESQSLEEVQDKISTSNLPIENVITKGTDANTQSFINGLTEEGE